MRVRCVGHPLADMIPLEVDKTSARVALNLEQSVQVLALLPGSRSGEVGRLTPEFLACAELCAKRWPDMQFVIPCANPARREQIEGILNQQFQHLAVTLVDGRSREVMAASDAILIASGTATLEALLLKKPMLVCYKMSALSYALISRMLKAPYFSLPNLLAGKKLVEERVQNEVNAPALMNSLHTLLEDEDKQKALNMEYLQIHQTLRRNANSKAAKAVLELISQQGNADIAVP
jgi:lipid-A-disaccharide synthase